MQTTENIDSKRCEVEGEHMLSTRHTEAECPVETGEVESMSFEERAKTLLANRIKHNSEALDTVRREARKVWSPEDAAGISSRLADHLARIAELERVWQALYGEVPSVVEVYQSASE